MMTNKMGLAVLGTTVAALLAWGMSVHAYEDKAPKRDKGGAKEITLVGRIVDLQCHMSGQYPSDDKAKCTADCIKAGVPAAIESAQGLVVIGQGAGNPSKIIAPFAFKRAQITGKLYEKNGLKYIDVASAVEQKAPEGESDKSEE